MAWTKVKKAVVLNLKDDGDDLYAPCPHQPKPHEYRRDLERQPWSTYEGNYKYLRKYRRQSDNQLAMLSDGADHYIVP